MRKGIVGGMAEIPPTGTEKRIKIFMVLRKKGKTAFL